MAAATAQLVVNAWPSGMTTDQTRTVIYGTCTLSSGGDYVTNGIPLNWTGKGTNPIQDGNFDDAVPFLGNWGPDQTQPVWAEFESGGETAGTTIPGYVYTFDAVNNTLRISNGSGELSDTTVPTADKIVFRAEFLKNAF